MEIIFTSVATTSSATTLITYVHNLETPSSNANKITLHAYP